jgi:hypothetical protein
VGSSRWPRRESPAAPLEDAIGIVALLQIPLEEHALEALVGDPREELGVASELGQHQGHAQCRERPKRLRMRSRGLLEPCLGAREPESTIALAKPIH